MNWKTLAKSQMLSEDFMQEHAEKLNWSDICSFQQLSEQFMETMEKFIIWDTICRYQTVSETFVLKYMQEISLVKLFQNKNCSFTEEQKKLFIRLKN